MAQNVISQRLVNATNILFHLMDLQPYALVLPMSCKTAERNKRKIMQKIMMNNRPIDCSVAIPIDNKGDAEDKKQEIEGSTGPSSDGSDKSGTTQTDTTTEVVGNATSTGEDAADKPQTCGASSESTLSDATHKGEPPSHARNKTSGTRSVIPNKDPSKDISSESAITASDYDLPLDDVNSPFFTVNHVIERLDSEDMKGCMIMLAARCDSYFAVVPLAGGVIEIYDEHERSIQAMWMNRALEQRPDVRTLMKTLVLRIFAHAYQIQLPDKRNTKSNKLVSIYQSLLITFPRECRSFIESEMLLSKHYEAAGFNEPHNDNPKVPCRCHKVAHQASEMFYGISESRFNNLYTNLYEKMLFEAIGKMTPIVKMFPVGAYTQSEKIDQIAKAVREIERSVKDQGTNKKGRRA